MKYTQSRTLACIAGAALALVLLTACENTENKQISAPAAQAVSADASAAARMAKPPLTDTKWVLETVLGNGVETYGLVAAPELQLASGENRVMGSTPINRFNGSYKLDGEKVGFMQLVTTRMAGDDGAMRLENVYTKMLESVDRWKITDGELQLFAGPAQVASFKAK